jgi:hypothetical protein
MHKLQLAESRIESSSFVYFCFRQTQRENTTKIERIGLLSPNKYMNFIFFPENTLKKLHKSMFSEF